jgi:hypothetical protein
METKRDHFVAWLILALLAGVVSGLFCTGCATFHGVCHDVGTLCDYGENSTTPTEEPRKGAH